MRVILFLLKCLVGIFATLGLVVVGLGVGAFYAFDELDRFTQAPIEVPEAAVIILDLTGPVVEMRPENPLSRASLGSVLVMRELVETLDTASTDPAVKGVLMRVGGGLGGLADVQEVREALAGFRAQGKFVIAFAESFGELGNGTVDYYLASVADQVWLQPSGDLDLTGFAIESPFAKDLLDLVGIESQMGEREEYKGALSVFQNTAMPAPQRENLQRLLDSWMDQLVSAVAASRSVDEAAVRDLINKAPYGAAEGPALGLIDELGYWDQVSVAALDRAGPSADYLSFQEYRQAKGPENDDGTGVALIYGLGPVSMGQSENDPVFGSVVMGSDTVAKALSDAIEDPDIEAIIFRVDSPGGSYVASDTIWREVKRARDARKPLILSMGNLAASGGYFVAAPASKIVAQPGTITGSIGVAAGKFVLSGLWDKVGVNWDTIKAGQNADLWSSAEPFSEQGWQHLDAALDRTYADFLQKVAEGRGFSQSEVREVAKGQVWTGADAKEKGLVDELGGYNKAFELVRSSLGLAADAPITLHRLPEPSDPFQTLIEDILAGELYSPGLARLAALVRSWAPWLTQLEAVSAGHQKPRLEIQPAAPAQN